MSLINGKGTFNLPYDKNDPKSIESYALRLQNKTLRQSTAFSRTIRDATIPYQQSKDKGSYGNLVQEKFFFYKPNSRAEADFVEAGVELKTVPLKKLKNGELVAKERLVANMIDFEEMAKETWEKSSFLNKNSLLLLIFYLHEYNIDILDYLIKYVKLWRYSPEDLLIIKQDWEKIKAKILAGKAHEISEGDTVYLGACTKGSSAKDVRIQPCSPIKAKQRALCLKQNYVNSIIKRIDNSENAVTVSELKTKSFEDVIIARFEKYKGKTVAKLVTELNVKCSPKAKNFASRIAAAMIGVKKEKITEFEKGAITIKSISLEENNKLKESISFPRFVAKELVLQEWEESDFFRQIVNKFFFVIFKKTKKGEKVLSEVKFWNMPESDLAEAKIVWEKTIACLKSNKTDELPKIKQNDVAHVRPHGRNKIDYDLTPVGKKFTKQCFWLNAKYIEKQLNL